MALILIVDDDANMRWALEKALKKDGHQIISRENGQTALAAVRKETPDLILCDYKMPGMDGLELLARIRETEPGLPLIMITGFGTIETAVEAMKRGASDVILKPFEIEAVKLSVAKALGIEKLKDEVRFWRQEAASEALPDVVGSSPAMKNLGMLIQQVAAAPATVLVTGESGTGKELVALSVHRLSPRRDQPMIKVNCAAIPENLIESELFGHEKGAFTGAVSRKAGRFERADHGTLFLDEIGELPLNMQVKLLRILQEKEFERVGGTETIKVDVRVIAATNRDLTAAIQTGQFREDLYYRLNVVRIEVPPLRLRREDIPDLAVFFVKHYAAELGRPPLRLADETLRLLTAYPWPGNVRELQNVLERAVILTTQSVIGPELLPAEVLHPGGVTGESGLTLPPGGMNLEALERSLIVQALERAGGNQTRAAALLGMTRYTLIYRMEKHGLR
ncbi:MAG: sigma-54-dependent transcriptional regulator [Solirubrobacterales bacterium]